MKPGQVIVLPKADKRYKPGKIVKDSKGKWRGNPASVQLSKIPIGNASFDPQLALNPPLQASPELMEWMDKQGCLDGKSS